MWFLSWLPVVSIVLGVLSLSPVSGFTPEDLLSAPWRSTALLNREGTFGFYSMQIYSFENHTSIYRRNLVNLKTGSISTLFVETEVQEIVWLSETTILYSNSTTEGIPGGLELWVTDITDLTKRYKAASLPAFLLGLKAVTTPSGVNFVVTGPAYENGTAYNPELVQAPLSSARVYDSLFVRHWDTYITPRKSAIFAGSLSLSEGVYSSSGGLRNLFSGVRDLETPVQPFGGTGDYDISPDGQTVTFLSKAPDLNPANNTASYIYVVPHSGSKKPVPINLSSQSYTPEGASTSPVFSPDSQSLAYLQQDENGYEADRNKLYVYNLQSQKTTAYAEDWDRSPPWVTWSKSGKAFLLIAEEHGRNKLWTLSASANSQVEPKAVTGAEQGSVALATPLSDDLVFLSTTSMISSITFSTLSLRNGSTTAFYLEPNKIDPQLMGFSRSSVGEFWYDGVAARVHGWITKPERFDKDKKYPIAFLIHGGPQGSWEDRWSVRWNHKLLAEQGYVVIAINPTGSTGYGQAFTDAIQNDWGGAPYEDLVKGFEYVVKTYPFLDENRAVALGASYGGYMVNWIQGHDFGRKFKALVSHDGVFSTLNVLSSEELFFPQHDFNGTLWDNRENYERWDPAAHIISWATPQLVIHNDLDYRLPISEGLAVFNALQERGVPSRFLNFPDENHFVSHPENNLVWYREVIGWINKWSAE